MTDRRLTDAQITSALRAHLPAHAQAGLRGRVFDAIDATPQRKPMPWFLAALSDADQITRRRTILLAAAILVALALATAIGVGALLESRRTVIDQLSLDQPADIDAWVSGAYTGIVDLPALSLTVVESEGTKGRWSYDGHGHVRLDHFFNPLDAEPGVLQLFTNDTMSETADVSGQQVWVEHTGQGNPLTALASATGLESSCPTPWTYVGLEYLLQRPTHHVVCGKSEMWLDIETRIPLKSIRGAPTLTGPTPDYTDTFTVQEFAIGPQPADLFVPPTGLAVMDDNEYECASDPACSSPAPTRTPPPSQRPVESPPPAVGDFTVPTDLDAFVAGVLAGYATMPALTMDVVKHDDSGEVRVHDVYDGTSRVRIDWHYDPAQPPTVYIVVPGHSYESFGLNDEGRPKWEDHGAEAYPGVNSMGIGQRCVEGWTHLGFDLVNGRPTDHLMCDGREYWVDREWGLVVRAKYKIDPLGDALNVDQVVDVQFGPPAPGSFDLTDDALICGSRGRDCRDMSGKPYHTPSPSPDASSPG